MTVGKLKEGTLDDRKGLFLSRVAEITVLFWILKIMTTGMGEVFSDFLNYKLRIDHTVLVVAGLILLIGSLLIQFSFKKYVPWAYWLVVSLISIYGTLIADDIHDLIGISYVGLSLLLFGIVAVILLCWFISEKTLSIHSIISWRRETFYWSTVLVTFALGTAVGDMTAETFGWGTLYSGIIFSIVILLPLAGIHFFKLNRIFAFWFSYILTRPLGASFADWFSQSPQRGGLDFGQWRISLIMSAAIIAFVVYLTMKARTSREMHIAPENYSIAE